MWDKRIPEPFCLVDMGITAETHLTVQIAEGAVLGNEALREEVMRGIEAEEKEEAKRLDEESFWARPKQSKID